MKNGFRGRDFILETDAGCENVDELCFTQLTVDNGQLTKIQAGFILVITGYLCEH